MGATRNIALRQKEFFYGNIKAEQNGLKFHTKSRDTLTLSWMKKNILSFF